MTMCSQVSLDSQTLLVMWAFREQTFETGVLTSCFYCFNTGVTSVETDAVVWSAKSASSANSVSRANSAISTVTYLDAYIFLETAG